MGAAVRDLVTVLPLLPTFNTEWPEPSPYSPVSRLFWSELVLDLGEQHRPVRDGEAGIRNAEGVHPTDLGVESQDL